VNGRKSPKTLYTSATGKNCDTLTVSSPDSQVPISSPMTEKNPLAIFANELRSSVGPVTSLSRSSEAVPSSGSSLHDQAKFPKLSPNNIPNFSSVASSPSHQHKDNNKSAIANQQQQQQQLSPRTNSAVSSTQSLLKTNHKSFFSSSELSSADECSNMGSKEHKSSSGSNKRRRTDDRRGPLALIAGNSNKNERTSSDHKDFLPDDSNSATESVNSGGVIMSRSDSSRVKIMEGGFESNEDYTYVRGRGESHLKNNS